MIIYNKLVRDLIPNIIIDSGKQANIKYLSNEEVKEFAVNKLQEELNEFIEAKNNNDSKEMKKELADMLEIYYKVLNCYDFTIEEIENIRIKKNENRGSFKENIILIGVDDN